MRGLWHRDGIASGRSIGERVRGALSRAQEHWARIIREGPRSVGARDLRRAEITIRRFGWTLTRGARIARPVFIVGLQRSGTEMIVQTLRNSPLIKVYNEHKNSAAFRDYALRSDDTLINLMSKSRCQWVAFKALNDTHRIVHLLEHIGNSKNGRAIWTYRSVEGRTRSILAKFGDVDLQILRRIAEGTYTGWELDTLSKEKLELIRSFDYDDMTSESAAALGWYLRNSLFFELELDQREDILLASYDAIVAEPAREIQGVCAFLDVPHNAQLHDHIAPRPDPTQQPLEIDVQLARLCEDVYERLEAKRRSHTSPQSTGIPRGLGH